MITVPTAHITSTAGVGYECVASQGIGPSDVSVLEQLALPYGSDWKEFVGARCVKAFPLSAGNMAVACTRVTESSDEHGRAGVLDCRCVVLPFQGFRTLMGFPGFLFDPIIRGEPLPLDRPLATVPRKPLPGVQFAGAKARLGRPIRITHTYTNAAEWVVVEERIREFVAALPPKVLAKTSFATLTLSGIDRVTILALPAARA